MSSSNKSDTFFGRALADVESELGGRWAKPKPMMGGAAMPEQPATTPWSSDPVGIEPPLGFSVEEMVPVGEHHEIEASIAALEAAQQRRDEDDDENDEGPQ